MIPVCVAVRAELYFVRNTCTTCLARQKFGNAVTSLDTFCEEALDVTNFIKFSGDAKRILDAFRTARRSDKHLKTGVWTQHNSRSGYWRRRRSGLGTKRHTLMANGVAIGLQGFPETSPIPR